jgi:hypothetical protein
VINVHWSLTFGYQELNYIIHCLVCTKIHYELPFWNCDAYIFVHTSPRLEFYIVLLPAGGCGGTVLLKLTFKNRKRGFKPLHCEIASRTLKVILTV